MPSGPSPPDGSSPGTGATLDGLTPAPELSHLLVTWFLRNRRQLPWREDSDPYRIWVSEVMLQQTRSETVASYYRQWLERFPDVEALARADEQAVLKAWEGLGYYGRARNLHRAAREVVERFDGTLPADPEVLRTLPGIGEYTAAAVASIAFARPAGVVDGNVIRVVCRLAADRRDSRDPALRRAIRRFVEAGFRSFHPGWVNQAWMELGALVCLPRPRCELCPLRAHCAAQREGLTGAIPTRRSPGTLPVRSGSLVVVLAEPLPAAVRDRLSEELVALSGAGPEALGPLLAASRTRMLLLRRPPRGLLGGLWEFPNYPEIGSILRERAARIGICLLAEPGLEARHRYSHFEARLRIHVASAEPGKVADPLPGWEEQRWLESEQLSRYPRPQVHIKAMRLLGLEG
jgi:A/G-specific adenine glycosylase